MQTGRPRVRRRWKCPLTCWGRTADVARGAATAAFRHPNRHRKQPSPARLALLRQAKYPLLFAGGGVAHAGASDVLLRLAERLRAPVLTTISGKGAIPDTSLWSAGCTWRTSSGPTDGYPALWRQADVGLVVGNRLTGMATRAWRLPLPPTLAHLDLDASEMGKSYPVAERLVGDARLGLEMLLAALEDGDSASCWDPHDVRAARDADDAAGEQRCPEALQLIRALRAGLPPAGILACDQAIACYWCVRHFPTLAPRRFLYPAGSASLGFGLPVGIGAQVARPDTPVAVLAGDGGLLFTLQELAMAVQYELPIAVIVVNDNAYGMIKAAQQRRNGKVLDTDLRNPDFVALGRAFGAHAERLSCIDELPGCHDRRLPAFRPVAAGATVGVGPAIPLADDLTPLHHGGEGP